MTNRLLKNIASGPRQQQSPLSRRSAAFGASIGALLAASVVGITAAALYLQIRNQNETELMQAPARAFARDLARQVNLHAENPSLLQQVLQRLQKREPSLERAMVVVEPRSTKYRFLRKRRYLAHSQSGRTGEVLNPRHAEDKKVYDLANQLRREAHSVKVVAPPGKVPRVQAATAIRRDGKPYAMALVVTRPTVPAPQTPAWPLGLGILLCIPLGALLGAASPRFRYLMVMAATAAFALFATIHLGHLSHNYEQLRQGIAQLVSQALSSGKGGGSPAAAPETLFHTVSSVGLGALWAAVLLALGIGLLGQLGIGRRVAEALSRHRFAYAYIAPVSLAMVILVFIPFGYGLGLGFFDHAHGHYTYVGLKNFVEILSGGGRPLSHPLNFYFTLGVTVLWTVSNVVLHVTIGLILALVLKDPLLGAKGVYRVLLILPWAVPNYITALIWKGMFHHQYGAVNYTLSLFGVERVSWFSSFSTAFTANVVTNTWLGFPFMMVVTLGAMQSIPKDLYEAAAVDGASSWQTFWRITLPLLRPALFPAIVIGSIWTFNMFNIIYLVSEGSPAGSSDILITEAYRWAFERADRYGLAAAYALIIFVILLGYTLLANRMAKATEDVME